MTITKKMNQLNMIIKKFENARNDIMAEIHVISNKITSDQLALNKIINYKNHYSVVNSGSDFGSSPAMLINNEKFLKRINDTILQQEKTIKMAEHQRSQYAMLVNKYEQKIKALNTIINKYRKQNLIYKENEETGFIDDIVSSRINRGDYE